MSGAGPAQEVPAGAEPSTPVFLKRDDEFEWPEELPLFYLVTSDGLFRCRNHEFFRSAVQVERGPGALAAQDSELVPSYPSVPRRLFERIVGFFTRIEVLHGSEAVVLLVWDRAQRRVRVVVPEQRATVSRGWYGAVYPIGLTWDHPADLPADWVVFGDAHSHARMAAYASGTDVHDEVHRPGLHLVVGDVHRDRPSFHVEAVADHARFPMELDEVVEGYSRPDPLVPRAWLERVRVEDVTWSGSWGGSSGDSWSASSTSLEWSDDGGRNR
jgi:hypothetical protein